LHVLEKKAAEARKYHDVLDLSYIDVLPFAQKLGFGDISEELYRLWHASD
jgi:hypothetical protein